MYIKGSQKEINDIADFLFEKEDWEKAQVWYEKLEKTYPTATNLIQLYKIAEKTKQPFDFDQFLSSNNADELREYAQFFKEKVQGTTIELNSDKIHFLQKTLRIEEKILQLDNTDYLQSIVAKEYSILGYYQLFLTDGKAAEASILRSLELDKKYKSAHVILPFAFLLQNRWPEAEAEFLKWKDKDLNMPKLPKYRDAFLNHLYKLELQGITHPDFEKARKLLDE